MNDPSSQDSIRRHCQTGQWLGLQSLHNHAPSAVVTFQSPHSMNCQSTAVYRLSSKRVIVGRRTPNNVGRTADRTADTGS